MTIANNHGLTPLEVINRYTDPRSGHNLKLLLQGEAVIALIQLLFIMHY